jgi:hypothetical protein
MHLVEVPMKQWRAELQALFADVALDGELGREDAVEKLLLAIRQWIASVFRATDLGSEPTTDALLDWAADRVSARARADDWDDPLFDHDGFLLAVALLFDLDFLEKARQAGELDQSLHCLARTFARIARESDEVIFSRDAYIADLEKSFRQRGSQATVATKRAKRDKNVKKWNQDWTVLRETKPKLKRASAARIIADRPSETASWETIRKYLKY